MYAGHFAIGLAIKARAPDIPAPAVIWGVVLLDLLNGLFVLVGLDQVVPDLSAGPYLFFDLRFIDWDHSLLMAAVWSAAWALLFFKTSRRFAEFAALAVFSHFLADGLVHNGDLALYPFADAHLGLGLWGRWGVWSWAFEGLFCAVLCADAWRVQQRRGVNWALPCAVVAVMFLSLSPWFSPMELLVVNLPEDLAGQLAGGMVASGFLLPGWLLLKWIARAQGRATAPSR